MVAITAMTIATMPAATISIAMAGLKNKETTLQFGGRRF